MSDLSVAAVGDRAGRPGSAGQAGLARRPWPPPAMGSLAAVWENRALRRVELAFAGFNAAECGVWIAMLVYAYDQGGAIAAGVVAILQLLPAALVAPVGATLADRRPPGRVLTLGYLLQAAAMGVTAAALLAGAPTGLVYGSAALAASAVTLTRPAQAALVPALVRRPEELTAANALSGWIEGISVLVGPAVAGVLLATGGAGAVFAVMAGVAVGAVLLTAPVPPSQPGPRCLRSPATLARVRAALCALRENGEPRLLVAALGAQYVVLGALDVLFVVFAVNVLDTGGSGAGYLNAAFAAGGVIGIVATASLIGRRRLVPALLLGVAAWSGAFIVIGLSRSEAAVYGLLAAAGTGRSLFDVAGRTLLQRLAPREVMAAVFGVLEGLTMAALALGALLAPALVTLGGPHIAFATVAMVLPALGVICGLRRIAPSPKP